MLTEAELDPYFDAVRREAFRVESLPAYAVASESAGLRAYLAGEPYAISDAGLAFKHYVRGQVESGIKWHRVRVVRGPLTDYERWECEWGYTANEQFGYPTFVLDLSDAAEPPDLPGYDWWMLDEQVVLRFHYDAQGSFAGADALTDAADLAEHLRYRDAALAAAAPFPHYWAAHRQYWRENWLRLRA